MMQANDTLKPPSKLLQWLEWRAVYEYASTSMLWPALTTAPKGDGHPVLVLPGFLASDRSTAMLRRFLRQQGYDTHGWGQGRNLGPRDGALETMLEKVDALHTSSGRTVSIIGWSLGGAYARVLADKRPEAVRTIVMLGSPIGGQSRATNAWRLYELLNGRNSSDRPDWAELNATSSVPASSIWTTSDGVVAWQNSLLEPGPTAENIRVHASHLGLGFNSAVLYAIADRLAQPEGNWQPFAAPRLLRSLYPKH